MLGSERENKIRRKNPKKKDDFQLKTVSYLVIVVQVRDILNSTLLIKYILRFSHYFFKFKLSLLNY